MTTNRPKKIAIIGAGPVGLEAALYARQLGHTAVVFERARVAENVASWGFVRLFSPWSMNASPLARRALELREPPDDCPTGHELRDHYLLPLARLLGDAVRERSHVITVGRDDFAKSDAIGSAARSSSPFRILVRNAGTGAERIERADVVLDCSGTYGNHRWAGRGGVPAPGERELAAQMWYTIPDVLGRDRARFADRHTLLLGAGHSAATVLNDVEKLVRSAPHTRLTWAIRRPGQALEAIVGDPLPGRRMLVTSSLALRDRPPHWLQFLGTCVLEAASHSDRFDLTLRHLQTNLVLTVDEVVALVGYRPDPSVYENLQVHQCYATDGPIKLSAALIGEGASDCLRSGASLGPEVLKNPEPDFFILGAKSYGTNSNFLLRVGHQQVRDVFKLIENDAQLDLYNEAKRQ